MIKLFFLLIFFTSCAENEMITVYKFNNKSSTRLKIEITPVEGDSIFKYCNTENVAIFTFKSRNTSTKSLSNEELKILSKKPAEILKLITLNSVSSETVDYVDENGEKVLDANGIPIKVEKEKLTKIQDINIDGANWDFSRDAKNSAIYTFVYK